MYNLASDVGIENTEAGAGIHRIVKQMHGDYRNAELTEPEQAYIVL